MVSLIKNKIKNLLEKGFFHILFGGTLTKVISFFSSILIVRFVSKQDYAFLGYADNIYSYVYLLTGLGFDSAILKYCVSDNSGKNKAFFSFAFKYGTISTVLIVLAALLYTTFFPLPFDESKQYLYALTCYPFLYYWVCLMQSFMRARLKNKQYAYASFIQTLLVFIISIGFVRRIGPFSVIVARYAASLVVLIYTFFVSRDDLNAVPEGLDSIDKTAFVRFGLSILIANVFSMVIPINEGFLVNNIIKDATISANYKVANLIPQQLTFVTSAIITYYFPYFARMKEKAVIWKESKKVGLFTAGFILVTMLIGILVSPFVIHLAYGDKYNDINYLMNCLWMMHALNAALRMLPMNILPAIGYTRFNIYMSVFACIFHLIVDYICISRFGVNGAVIAGCAVYLITAVLYWAYLRRKTELDKGAEYK